MGPFTGINLIARATTEILKRPRLVLIGMVPPLIVTALYIVVAFLGGPALVDLVTGWVTNITSQMPTWLGSLLAGVLIFAIGTGVAIIAGFGFTALSLLIGGPIYDRISTTIDREVLGVTPVESETFTISIARSAAQSGVVFGLSLVVAFLAVTANIIPIAGSLASLVIGLGLGGSLMTTELLSGGFGRRGMPTLRQRWAAMRSQPMSTLSFAVPAQFVLSLPLISVAAFPFFSAAATMLADKLIREAQPGVIVKDRTYDF